MVRRGTVGTTREGNVAESGEPRVDPASAPASIPPASAAPDAAPPITAGSVPESTAGPEGGRPRSNRRWLIIGGIAIVFLLIIGYVVGGAVAAGVPVNNADKALRTTIDHENAVVVVLNEDPFKGVDLSSSTVDVPKAKAALAGYMQKVSLVQPSVASDRNALQRVRPDLQSSFLTLPEQSTISRDRRRVDAALTALSSAQRGIDILKKQAAFVDALFDASANFIALGKTMQAEDLPGTAAQLPGTGASVKKAADLAQPPDVPEAFGPIVKGMQRAADDVRGLVAAVQANDQAAIQKYVAALEADGKALESIDQKAIDAAQKALFQPLIDSYNRNMKIAAGG